jgi:HD-like signal output (HDOD) protein
MPSDVQFLGREEKAKATLERIVLGIESGQAPVVGQIVEIIKEISGKSDRMSVNDLAETISRDSTMISRIIALATTLGYNPCGIEISSIHQAISVIGFDRIRTLAVAVLLIDSAESKKAGETLRELSGLALSSGLFASEMCRQGGNVDPDLVFLCGVLRNYGQILLATLMPGEYALVVEMSGYPAKDDAFQSVFGLTPLDLGRELLGQMKLPDVILNSLRPVPQLTGGKASNPVIALAELGLRLAEMVSSSNVTLENYGFLIHQMSAGFGEDISLSENSSKELLRDVAARMTAFCARGDISRNSLKLFQRMESLASGLPLPPPFRPARKGERGGLIPAQGAVNPVPGTAASNLSRSAGLLDVATESLSLLVRKSPADQRHIFDLLLRVLQDALRLESCLLFLKERSGTRFLLNQGDGPILRDVQQSLALDPVQRDVFTVPLTRGEDVFIENPDDPKIQRFVPEWLRRPGKTRPFILLPIKDRAGPFALICGTSADTNAFAVVEQVFGSLRRIRAEVSLLGPQLREPPSQNPSQPPRRS